MRICGIKFGHDGSVAVIDDGRLLFSAELEKFDNETRHRLLHDVEDVFRILRREGLAPEDIDRFVVDGWHAHSRNLFHWGAREVHLPRGPYIQTPLASNLLDGRTGRAPGEPGFEYASWPHYAGHAVGAWCSSPFAGESAWLLSWDGGMAPYLYYANADAGRIENVGALFGIVGDLYAEVAAGRGPFKANPSGWESLGSPGKIMAYVAHGSADEVVIERFREHFARLPELRDDTLASLYPANMDALAKLRADPTIIAARDEDVITSYHEYIQRTLIDTLSRAVEAYPHRARRLCFAGGCALNIKWNQAIRETGLFDDVWVPPFPNDAGSALGAAACSMLAEQGRTRLEWNVYAGPALCASTPPSGWSGEPCSIVELARLLHEQGEPVVVLNGRAEIGPRALGNRSILAPAVRAQMKQHLNDIKDREDYRPVAPICLEEHARSVFDPGGADPYMLYDHAVRADWVERVPAILHLDGTARLQTVDAAGNPQIHELLSAYHGLSGIPLLCNTSANYKGKGFFPDVASAAEWGGVHFVWSEGMLYRTGSS